MIAPAIERAVAHFKAGRIAESERACEEVLQHEPEHPGALNLLGNAARRTGRKQRAVELFALALRRGSADPDNHSNLAAALCSVDRHEEALASCDAALALRPDHVTALANKATALQGLGRNEEALALCDRAIALAPEFADAHGNRGRVLNLLGRFDEALASFDLALALRPETPSVRLSRAVAELALGDFARGWEDYESRWLSEDHSEPKRDFFRQPLWLGREDLRGRTILLHAEQGLGDTLQFLRYVPLVAARGARVVLEVQTGLCELAAGIAGVEHVIERGAPLPPFDFRCPLLSLPLAFDTRMDSIPAEVPYLMPPAAAVAKWRARLGRARGPRIGIVWSGSARHANDRNRSLTLARFAGLREPGAQFVSLQKELRPEDADALAGDGDLHHFGPELEDFTDTAALVSLMDLVISVDTSVAHLAGAMGVPVWILLPHAPDWRWMTGRDDSPWYPTARLFRQPQRGDWDSVLAAVRRGLRRKYFLFRLRTLFRAFRSP